MVLIMRYIENEKLLLENTHNEMYGDKLEYLIYGQRYGMFDIRNYNGLLNEIIEEIYKI